MTKTTLHRLARLGLVLSAALSPLAHAGLVSYSTTVGSFGGFGSGNNRVSYQRFDADLGVLREVRFTFDMSANHTMLYANTGDEPLRLSLRYGNGVHFDTPGSWSAGTDKTEFLEVAGHTGQTAIERSWSEQRSFSITSDLGRYIGDTPAWMDYRLTYYALGSAGQGSTLGFGSMTSSRVNLRLDYLYDEPPPPAKPLPEPGSLALVLAACAAAGAGRRALQPSRS